jgi:hypothetical protein
VVAVLLKKAARASVKRDDEDKRPRGRRDRPTHLLMNLIDKFER